MCLKRNIKLTIAYDGSGYHGWQRQADGIVTVQQLLEEALVQVTHHPVKLRGSGRTDTGVHADGQVANFFTDCTIPAERIHLALNARLPKDIRVRKAEPVPDDFDSIGSSRSKLYRYTLFNHADLPPKMVRYCYHYWRECAVEPMQQAAAYLEGQRDFACFQSAGAKRESTVRHLMQCRVHREDHWVHFDLEADGFLYNMVRNIVGTLLEVGRGNWPPEKIKEVLAAQDRKKAGPKAPPNGLTLMWVKY
jgi:tRNA pseudouridine38-40 synthase